MSKLSHRYLVEQKWRKEGDLDLLVGFVLSFCLVLNLAVLDGAHLSNECRSRRSACTQAEH